METNLIFRRAVTLDGVTKAVTRMVHVNIPEIDSGEGWTLAGHADVIEICSNVGTTNLAPNVPSTVVVVEEESKPDELVVNNSAPAVSSAKFESAVKGTAKLVRSKGVIKIAARRGKSTYNQTTPNSICIDDFTKNKFFHHCREVFGSDAGIYEFNSKTVPYAYNYWNEFIDKEYSRQLQKVNY